MVILDQVDDLVTSCTGHVSFIGGDVLFQTATHRIKYKHL